MAAKFGAFILFQSLRRTQQQDVGERRKIDALVHLRTLYSDIGIHSSRLLAVRKSTHWL